MKDGLRKRGKEYQERVTRVIPLLGSFPDNPQLILREDFNRNQSSSGDIVHHGYDGGWCIVVERRVRTILV